MRAVTIDRPETPPAVRDDLHAPAPADTELLVRVHASSVNPVDNSIAAGMLAQNGRGVRVPGHPRPRLRRRGRAGRRRRQPLPARRPGLGFLLHANPTAHDGAWAELITVIEDLHRARARRHRPGDRRRRAAGRHHGHDRRPRPTLRRRRAARVRPHRRRRQPRGPARRARRRPRPRTGAARGRGRAARARRQRRPAARRRHRRGSCAPVVPDGVDALLDLVNYTARRHPTTQHSSPTRASPHPPAPQARAPAAAT